MSAIENVRHQLSLAIRVVDHFTGAPWPEEVEVTLDSLEPAIRPSDRRGSLHRDGTYRFVGVRPGVRQITVRVRNGTAFTWSASSSLTLPQVPALLIQPLVIELWPGPNAQIQTGALAIRGRLVHAAAGQEVAMEVVGVAPRNRRTRCDAQGEFVFVVAGPAALTSDHRVELAVTVPGRVLTSIQILDGDTDPVVAGTHFTVVPGRETRARFNLT